MATPFKIAVNKPGAVYDEEDTKHFFAEEWNAVTEAINALENLLAGGATGSFTTVDGKTVTVMNGLITSIV